MNALRTGEHVAARRKARKDFAQFIRFSRQFVRESQVTLSDVAELIRSL